MSGEILTQAQYLIALSSFPDIYWSTFSGLEITSDQREVDDGKDTFFLSGKMTVQPMTLARIGEVEINKRILEWSRNFCRNSSSEILSVIPLKPCESLEVYPDTLRILGVRPTRVRAFQAEKTSSDRSNLEISITARDFTYGN